MRIDQTALLSQQKNSQKERVQEKERRKKRNKNKGKSRKRKKMKKNEEIERKIKKKKENEEKYHDAKLKFKINQMRSGIPNRRKSAGEHRRRMCNLALSRSRSPDSLAQFCWARKTCRSGISHPDARQNRPEIQNRP